MSAIVITALPVADDADTTRGATTATFGAEVVVGATIVVVVVDVVDALTTRHTTAKPELTKTTPANKQAPTVL